MSALGRKQLTLVAKGISENAATSVRGCRRLHFSQLDVPQSQQVGSTKAKVFASFIQARRKHSRRALYYLRSSRRSAVRPLCNWELLCHGKIHSPRRQNNLDRRVCGGADRCLESDLGRFAADESQDKFLGPLGCRRNGCHHLGRLPLLWRQMGPRSHKGSPTQLSAGCASIVRLIRFDRHRRRPVSSFVERSLDRLVSAGESARQQLWRCFALS